MVTHQLAGERELRRRIHFLPSLPEQLLCEIPALYKGNCLHRPVFCPDHMRAHKATGGYVNPMDAILIRHTYIAHP